jgi:hypothetical protein
LCGRSSRNALLERAASPAGLSLPIIPSPHRRDHLIARESPSRATSAPGACTRGVYKKFAAATPAPIRAAKRNLGGCLGHTDPTYPSPETRRRGRRRSCLSFWKNSHYQWTPGSNCSSCRSQWTGLAEQECRRLSASQVFILARHPHSFDSPTRAPAIVFVDLKRSLRSSWLLFILR